MPEPNTPNPMGRKDVIGLTFLGPGLVLFIYQTGELLTKHTAWIELYTPPAVGELLRAFAGALAIVLGISLVDINKVLSLLRKE